MEFLLGIAINRGCTLMDTINVYGFSMFISVIEEVRKSPSPDFEDQDPESIGFIKVNRLKMLLTQF